MTRRLALVLLFCLTIFGCEGDYTIYDVNPPEVVYVEVPVEVLVDVPGTGGDVWVDNFVQPYTVNGVDIVWLIAQSGSMDQYEPKLLAGIEQMINALPPSGWRLGIATTDSQETQLASSFPLVPGDTAADAEAILNSILFSYREAGFDALYGYLEDNTYNQTWLRDDAALLVVFVSDEQEQSFQHFTGTNQGVLDFVQWYGDQRPSAFLASIVHLPFAESVCEGTVSPINVGSRYIQATNSLNGVVVDICSTDWSPGVTDATNQIEPHEEWPLSHTPLEATLIVFEDSVEKPDSEWVYNPATNSVEFLVVPYEGALVEIGYVIDHDAGDDDDSAGDDDDSATAN